MDPAFHPSDRYAVLWLAVCSVPVAIWLSHPRPVVSWAMLTSAAVLGLTLLAVNYRCALPNWKDTRALQAAIDRKTAQAPSVQFSFARPAIAFWWLGDRSAAQRCLEAGEQRFPGHPAVATARDTLKDFDRRWRERVGSRVDIPPLAVLHVDLGRAWLARGESAAAAAHFTRALRLAPEYRDAAHGLLQSRLQR
jgi:hypothetical protein